MCLILALAPVLSAQEKNSEIDDIRVEGAPQVERGQILSGIRTRVGDSLDAGKITSDIKQIFNLGFFQEVVAEFEQLPTGKLLLIFRVVGKPRIGSIEMAGFSILGDSKLEEVITLKVGNVYSLGDVDNVLEKIRQAYREKGYFKVKLRTETAAMPGNTVKLTLIAEETPRLFITEIRTRNNTVFTELEIKRMMSSAEIDCFNWINDSGVFDEMKINQDLQVVSAKYLSKGYLRLLIEKPDVKLSHNREFSKITVTLTFREGEQFNTGKVDLAGDILGKKSDLLDVISLKTGDPFDPFKHNQDRFTLNEIYQEQGYAFARVVPDIQVNDRVRTVDVTYRVLKGDKAYIGRIEFQGNRETRDYVMRREFEMQENELFNGRKLRISQEKLTRLGYFKPGLKLIKKETDVDNVLDVVTEVEETQTGTAQVSLGVSDQSGLTASVSVSKGNLFGRGQTVRLTATSGQKVVRESYSFDFIDPRLFDSQIASNSSISKTATDDVSELQRGTITELRLSQGFGFPLVPLVKWNVAGNLTKRSFERPVNEPRNLRMLTNSLTYDSVNHPIFPSSGMRLILSLAQIGGQVLGGDTEFRRYHVRHRQFFSLNQANTLVVATRLRLGWIQQVGDHVIPLEDRFRLGGIASIHGYNFGEIGGPYGKLERRKNSDLTQAYDENGYPVVDSNGNPVEVYVDRRSLGLNDDQLAELRSGGTQERLMSVELLFPLAGDNIRGVVFYDAGNVNAEQRQYEILDEPIPGPWDLLQAAGFGIRMITPLGVFRFEYGIKLRAEPGESSGKFDFTISSLF